MESEGRLKTALDESRLLILGAQVLFGFQFEAVFQELFPEIPTSSRYIHCAGLVMLLISIGLLIAPSLFHQIIFDGESRPAALTAATVLAGARPFAPARRLRTPASLPISTNVLRGFLPPAQPTFTL